MRRGATLRPPVTFRCANIWFSHHSALIVLRKRESGMSSNGLQGVAFVALAVIIVMAIFGGFGAV